MGRVKINRLTVFLNFRGEFLEIINVVQNVPLFVFLLKLILGIAKKITSPHEMAHI